MTTGKKIRARRKQLGMSVDDLAAKLGKNRATIYRYENDMIEMPASLLKPLAEILDTTPGELMDWGDIMVSEIEHQEKMCELLPQIRNAAGRGQETHAGRTAEIPSIQGPCSRRQTGKRLPLPASDALPDKPERAGFQDAHGTDPRRIGLVVGCKVSRASDILRGIFRCPSPKAVRYFGHAPIPVRIKKGMFHGINQNKNHKRRSNLL